MRFSTSVCYMAAYMVAYIAIANPLPSWDLSQIDLLTGTEIKDSTNPDQTKIALWEGGSGSPQNWYSQQMADRGFKPTKPSPPSPRITKPAPFSACKNYKSFCCDDSRPASTQVRINCRPFHRSDNICKKNSNICCCAGMIERGEIHDEYSDDQLEAWNWKDSMKGGIAQPCVRSDVFPGAEHPYGPDLPYGPAGTGDRIIFPYGSINPL